MHSTWPDFLDIVIILKKLLSEKKFIKGGIHIFIIIKIIIDKDIILFWDF